MKMGDNSLCYYYFFIILTILLYFYTIIIVITYYYYSNSPIIVENTYIHIHVATCVPAYGILFRFSDLLYTGWRVGLKQFESTSELTLVLPSETARSS